jgi:hypothetical protein
LHGGQIIKIKESQFSDIRTQEAGWYDKILKLGEIDAIEVKTFRRYWKGEIHEPSEDYLSIIKDWLKENTTWKDSEINVYLGNF